MSEVVDAMRRLSSLALTVGLTMLLACAGEPEIAIEPAPDPSPTPPPLQLILIGGPGAGKGTQAALLEQKHGIPHISTGQLLRDEVARGTELGRRVEGVMQRGELVDDDTVLGLVRLRLDDADTQAGFILDGFPRTGAQVDGLEEILENRPDARVRALLLEVSDAEMLRRLLSRGRADDVEETIRRRIERFHAETADAIEAYESQGELIRINGEQSIEAVTAEIEAALASETRGRYHGPN